MQMVLWCYPRQKQPGWWEVADDAELGCRDYKQGQDSGLALFRRIEMCLSRAALVLLWAGRKEGRKETMSQHWPLFSLCMLRVWHWFVAVLRDLFSHSEWASLHGSRRGALVHRALQAEVGWFIWTSGTRQWCLGDCFYYHSIWNAGLRVHPCKHRSRRIVCSGCTPSWQKPNWFKVREERRGKVVVAGCQIQRGGVMCPQAALSAHKPSEQERGQTACIGTAVSSHFLTAGGPWMHRPHWWDVPVLTFSSEGFVSPKA